MPDTKQTTRRQYKTPETFFQHKPTQVKVLGAGGTGGEVLDHLCRLNATLQALGHPGLHVTVYDGGIVKEANVGRQRFSPNDVGQHKAPTLVSRINMFYGLKWEGIPFNWDGGHNDIAADLLISATDSAVSRHEIARVGDASVQDDRHSFRYSPFGPNQRSKLWLDFGNDAHTGQAVLGLFGDPENGTHEQGCPKLPHIIDLYPDMAESVDDGPSCSVEEAIASQSFGVNATLVANTFATIVWPLFRQGGTSVHGMFMDVAEGSVSPLHVDPTEWAMLGYNPEIESATDDTEPEQNTMTLS